MRDKFLTEAMGGAFACVLEEGLELEGTLNGIDPTCVMGGNDEYWGNCCYATEKGSPEDCEYWQMRIVDGIAINFSTWQGFGQAWEWAQKQGWWEDFWIYSNDDNGIIDFIHPDRFADALYEFLKDR